MGKWIVGILLVAGVGYVGYDEYRAYQAGFYDLPELDENSYVISFESGLRAIVVDPDIPVDTEAGSSRSKQLSKANPERQYLGLSADVPPWFEDTWSYCHPPTDKERATVERDLNKEQKRDLIGARFEAVCKIDADGESIWRGLIYSVPKQ